MTAPLAVLPVHETFHVVVAISWSPEPTATGAVNVKVGQGDLMLPSALKSQVTEVGDIRLLGFVVYVTLTGKAVTLLVNPPADALTVYGPYPLAPAALTEFTARLTVCRFATSGLIAGKPGLTATWLAAKSASRLGVMVWTPGG